jgi:hypothetical protein
MMALSDSCSDKSAVELRVHIPGEELAIETWVVPLGDGRYRFEDPWHTHPLRLREDGNAIGGLGFRDVFLAELLADGSLHLNGVVHKGNWRAINWFLGSILRSPHLGPAFAKIEEHGGFAEEDPWIGAGWLWIFLPPETDYDPTNDFNEVIKVIPREEILTDYEEWRKRYAGG